MSRKDPDLHFRRRLTPSQRFIRRCHRASEFHSPQLTSVLMMSALTALALGKNTTVPAWAPVLGFIPWFAVAWLANFFHRE